MSFVKRNRIVSIRVTEDEYQTLERLSRRHGANSVSEFLRQLIMSSEPFASSANGGAREVTEELDQLKQKLDRLAQIVKQHLTKQGSLDVVPEEPRAQIAALQHSPAADR